MGGKGNKGVLRRAHSRKLTVSSAELRSFTFYHHFIISRSVLLFLFLYLNMPKSLFDRFMEKELLRLYVEVFAGSSGRTLTTAEKHTTIAERLSFQGVVLGWPTVTASNVDNKTLSATKGRKFTRPVA